jgi:hypothetical protein
MTRAGPEVIGKGDRAKIIMRVYQPDLNKMKIWKVPKAEILKK